MTYEDISRVLDARSATILFGASEAKGARKEYRRLARLVHPDMFTKNAEKERAAQAFARLNLLWESMSTTNGGPTKSNTVKTRRHEYVIEGEVGTDDIFTTFAASYDAGYEHCLIAVAKDPQDNDLASARSDALRKLKNAPDSYSMYYPDLVESFRYRQAGIDHPACAEKVPEGFRPLTDVLKAYPQGIDGKDVAWMFRRMLVALGNAHDLGLIHSAPFLEAFLIHPQMHGVILTGWQYSVPTGESLKAVPSSHKSAYPPSALSKEPVDYRLDIKISANAACELLKNDQPSQLRAFFKGCQVASPPVASVLLAEFDELLERLYGKRSFHEFVLPE
jgi:hypothetical protein